MPKMKTKRAAAKRYRVTGTGKIKVAGAYKSHILTKKSRKRKRNMRKGCILSPGDARLAKACLPYA
jgi:large subunit ribosomal protein L35